MSLLHDLTMGAIVSRIAGMLIFVALHGGMLALMARLLGSAMPEKEGRLTASPLAHLSLWGLAMAVLFRAGWARPAHIDPAQLRGGRPALVAIAVAALLISLALVPLLDLARPWIAASMPRTAGYAVLTVIVAVQDISLLSVAINALPLPGLTGGLVLVALFPDRARLWRRLEIPVLAAIVILMVAGVLVPDRLLPILRPIFSSL
ncbi:hypothetical protein [Pelagibacterium lacus]|uniref:Peptidase M50 domain-containing protein n=1 Tax=Pelagibacterium lacus TaxID=2282655 RepID=A0A369W7R9_9HYPH|nr:hypothetical protein [Pelagibacterium lacus]RDE10067.1 hypothetical protein DVH29_03825 [Pelagibacterium lacus]